MNHEYSASINETVQENKAPLPERNVYPALRHALFVIILLFFVVILLFLVYQNGKSLYDNGI